MINTYFCTAAQFYFVFLICCFVRFVPHRQLVPISILLFIVIIKPVLLFLDALG